MKTFKEIKQYLIEKIKIHTNKSIQIYFNSYEGHTLENKLERANISETEFKQSLNKITKIIKQDKLNSNNYVFMLDNFKLPTYYDEQKKKLFISTILTKNMKPKNKDVKIMIESVQYNIIYV